MAYQPVWHAGFIWDDNAYVTANPLLTVQNGLWRIWFSFDSPSQYFPLVYTAFRLERALWGLNPAGYHWVNILLHVANALLLWRLLARMGVTGAWLAAAIFALHPVQVETVAWITELKNVLMLFFFLLTLMAWVEFLDEKTKRGWNFYALALIFYALALCAKTTACTLPAALLLILWLKEKPITRWRLVEIAPFVAFGIGMGLLTMWWERYHQGTQGKLFALGLMERILVASRAVCFYAGKLLWPANLTFSYPRWRISAINPSAYGWLLATAGLGAAICCVRRHVGRSVEVAVLFFVTTLAPVLGFIMLYTFRYSFVADHYQYVASIGLITLFSAGLAHLAGYLKQRRPWLEVMVCLGLLLALGTLTWRQARIYYNAETLWQTTIRRNPGCWMACNNLGLDYFQQGRMDEAIAQFQKALAIQTNDSHAHHNLGLVYFQQDRMDEAIAEIQTALAIEPDYASAHNNLGLIYSRLGRLDEAIAQYQKALTIARNVAEYHYNLGNALLRRDRPDEAIAQYQQALAVDPDDAKIHCNLGNALQRRGRLDEAIAQYQRALTITPNVADVRCNLGNALLQRGRLSEAIAQYQRALVISPTFAKAHCNLGNALLQQGRLNEAITEYQTALAIHPDYLEVQNSLAWVLATCPQALLRNGHQAVELAQRANQLTGGGSPVILCTLAAAYAETGRFPEAEATAQRALQLARAQSNTALANALESQIKLYQAGTPFHLTEGPSSARLTP